MKNNPSPVAKSALLVSLFTALLSGNAHAIVDIGTVTIPAIGHYYSPPNGSTFLLPGEIRGGVLGDFLIDQGQTYGGALLPSLAANWDTNTQFTVTIAAPPGKMFFVHVPPGAGVQFGGMLSWESTRGGNSPVGPVSQTFAALQGSAPAFTANEAVLSDSHGYFGVYSFSTTSVSNDFAFTAITLRGTVVPQYTGNGTEVYVPDPNSGFEIVTQTTATNDPGRFVFLVSTTPGPTIQISTQTPADGTTLFMTGISGRTNVVQASADLVHWTPISTNVLPVTSGSIPAAVYVIDPPVAGRNQQFYRAVQLP